MSFVAPPEREVIGKHCCHQRGLQFADVAVQGVELSLCAGHPDGRLQALGHQLVRQLGAR